MKAVAEDLGPRAVVGESRPEQERDVDARQAELTGERLQSLASAFREALPTNGAAAKAG